MVGLRLSLFLLAIPIASQAKEKLDLEGIRNIRFTGRTGKATAGQLKITATREPVSLRISSSTLLEGDRNGGTGTEGVCFRVALDAGCAEQVGPLSMDGGVSLVVEIPAMHSSGDYHADLIFSSTDLDANDRISAHFIVSDGPLLPFFCIFVGVVLGAFVNFLAGKFRTREQLELRLLRLERAAKSWTLHAPIAAGPDLPALVQQIADAQQDNEAFLLETKAVDQIEAAALRMKTTLDAFAASVKKTLDALAAKGTDVKAALQELNAGHLDAANTIAMKLSGAPTPAVKPQPPSIQDRTIAVIRSLNASAWAIAILSAVVATVSGMIALYTPPFGTITQYGTALLWGLGVDASVRGFSGFFKKFDAA